MPKRSGVGDPGGDDRVSICGAVDPNNPNRWCTLVPHTRADMEHFYESVENLRARRLPGAIWPPSRFGGYLPPDPPIDIDKILGDDKSSNPPPDLPPGSGRLIESGTGPKPDWPTGPVPSITEMEREEARRRIERGEPPLNPPPPRPSASPDPESSGPVPGSRTEGETWRRAVQEGAGTGGRQGNGETDQDTDATKRRRHQTPPSTPPGGTDVSVEDLKGKFEGIIARIVERQAQLHDVIEETNQLQGLALEATRGTTNDAAISGNVKLQEAATQCDEAIRMFQAAIEEYQTYTAVL